MPLDEFTMPRRAVRDERTGREVWQVTDGDFECVAAYMECGVWSADDRYLVVACNRTGTWQPYRLELSTGRARQLAHVVNGGYRSINVHAPSGEVFCWSGSGFLAVDLETLRQRQAADLSRFGALHDFSGGKGMTPALSGDAGLVAVGRGVWKDAPSPSCGIVLASLDGSNAFEEITVDHPDLAEFNLGHLMICPGDDDLLAFTKAHKDNPWNDGQASGNGLPNANPFLAAGLYGVSRRTGQVRVLVNAGMGYRATHCVWSRSGARVYWHRKSCPGWVPTALCSNDRQGGDLRVHFETDLYKLGHSQASPDERWIVTDSQDPDENILMLVETKSGASHLLCWPNASINSTRPDKRRADLPPHTDRHTHPGFSNTARYVHYTSDISGRSQVYVVPVGDVT